MTRAGLGCLLLALALAGCQSCPAPQEPPPPARAEAEDDEGSAAAGGDPWTDPEDYSGVTPVPSEAARVAPTPLDAPPSGALVVPAPQEQPNVVLVVGCTVRKDQLSPYGAPPEVTPFLAQLAREGTLFDDVVAAAPWTRVAATALETGRHAVSVGMVEPSPRRNDRRLPEHLTTLAEHLKERGYHTLGATANPNLRADFGFAQGFDAYQLGVPEGWKAKPSTRQVADAALDALRARQAEGDDRPFFLRLMVLDPHAPRDGGREAAAPWAQDDIPARLALYRHHLHQLDQGLAHLDEGLRGLGYDPSNTLFVFVTDHGEGMNYPDHHGLGHGQYFGASTVHVPWILRGPGVAEGHRVLGPASQIDVLPTVLGAIGRPLDDPGAVDGRDWSALVRGEAHRIDRPFVFSDTWYGGSNRAAIFTATHQCQEDFGSTARQRRRGKFVAGCFDRHADPLFTRPLDLPELRAELVAWRRAQEGLAARDAEQVTVDDELAEQLRVLGYR